MIDLYDYPDLLKELDKNKNSLKRFFVLKEKVWWICQREHSFSAAVGKRALLNQGCPYCANQKVLVGFNDLKTLFPDKAVEFNAIKNGIVAEMITAGSNKKVWWQCDKGHEWETRVADRIRSSQGCPYCLGQKAIIGVNDLKTVNPQLATEWHYGKNLKIDILSVMDSTRKKVWWLGSCGHEWEAAVYNRKRGTGCPYCTGRKVLVGFNDAITINPDIKNFWDYGKNSKNPENYTGSSTYKAFLLCNKGHSWQAAIYSFKRGSRCPVCVNKIIIEGFNDLATTHPELLNFWDYGKNSFYPQSVSYGSDRKTWWLCENNHSFKMKISHKTAGSDCPQCHRPVSKGEKEVLSFVQSVISVAIEENTRSVISPLELDIYIPSLNKAIEYNGTYWHSDKVLLQRVGLTSREYHDNKKFLCSMKNIDLLFVDEEHWKKNKKQEQEKIIKFLTI